MNRLNRRVTVLFILLALGATFAATQAEPAVEEGWVLPLVIVLWLATFIALLPSPLRRVLQAPLRWLRERPIFYWFVVVAYIFGAIVLWLVPYQPTNGRQ